MAESADVLTAEATAGAATERSTEERLEGRGEKPAEAGSSPGSGPFPLLRLLRRDFDADSGSDLSTARVVVAGGKGVGSKGGFAQLERLAAILGGAVGASRSAVEAGFAPYPMQVGQTGRTIRPEIYIACGISGSIQHLAGMSGSGFVVAINADRNAPIFDHADYGIVGDLGLVVDAMIGILETGAKAD
jgi:electron transfer flavoprotein alpha subunit